MAEAYVHDEVDDSSSGTGELNIQSVELGDCKELEQPFPLQASLCRKGVCVIMKDSPAKVSELKISKTGKHGSSKANMVGYDVITNRKYQETVPGHATMFSFEMKKMEYEVRTKHHTREYESKHDSSEQAEWTIGSSLVVLCVCALPSFSRSSTS